MNPTYPLYIVSKGRYGIQMTMRTLDRMHVPHTVIVEHQELKLYEAKAYPTSTFVVLDPAYQRDYDTLLFNTPSPGSGPARNFAGDLSRAAGAAWHWVMDDNIGMFGRLNHNLKVPVADGAIIWAMEHFVDRYDNVAMAGPNYFMFALRKEIRPPFYQNTRIYSCNLIRNDLPFRWKGRYNEDTILSLEMLKAGWCTILFNAFLQQKMPSQTMKGGNTSEFYAAEGTRPKSQMLVDAFPDLAKQGVVAVNVRFGRVHHAVNYNVFRQRLHLREGVVVPADPDNFGMKLQRQVDGEWVPMEQPWYAWEDAGQ